MGPFDITPEDIKRLDDEQLRKVLSFLLETEMTKNNIPLSTLILGGHQNAGDGGIDARLDWNGPVKKTTWLPKTLTIFQSKAEDMPEFKLKNELAPAGVPRPIFNELAQKEGAYIVFSTNNCSPEMYKVRLLAMRETIASVPLSNQIHLDFYDASRIARWVNSLPGVTNEVRTIIERPMAGWRPFENWSAPQLPISQEYLTDEKPKVTFKEHNGEPLLIVDGIDKVRELLRTSSKAIRLIGMSGVGKTRFSQALFDERVGKSPLNPGCVVYGDLSLSPETTASQVSEQLVHSQHETILIVDNCPGDTHRALSNITHRPGSNVHLLTIDFDVGPDQPENTEIVQLHQNDESLIEALLTDRAPKLSSLDRHKVVEFADGNARVALAISNNADGGGSLANLSDKQLINRLFLDERRDIDDNLQRCAEVVSLVYAFHVEGENDLEPEHPVLAELAETTEGDLFRAVAEFVERGFAQKRGTQRAILPQALAIKLATQSLEKIPYKKVINHFNQPGRKRLFRSFTRRLGFLHQSEPACRIAQQLLGQDGLLSDPTLFTSRDYFLFENLAPAAPEEALNAMERALSGPRGVEFASIDSPYRNIFADLARNLAYEVDFFERSAQLLLSFAKAEPKGLHQSSLRKEFLEMFWMVLSWTQAPPDQRYSFLENLLEQGNDFEKQLATEALSYALETYHFLTGHEGRFGSRPRGQEWRPKDNKEQVNWYQRALNLLTSIACSESENKLSISARESISNNIRGLINAGFIDVLVVAVSAVRQKGFWAEGWKQLCLAMHFDRKGWAQEIQDKAENLEQQLRPVSLEDRFSTYVMTVPWDFYPVNSENEEAVERGPFSDAEKVGEEAAKLPSVWPSLVNQAISYSGQNACQSFGLGLAKGVANIREMWPQMTSIFRKHETETRNPGVLCGFTEGAKAREPDEVQSWLDEAVTDEALGPHIVDLSIFTPVDQRSIRRLTESLHVGKVPLHKYGLLGCGKVIDLTPIEDLIEFFRVLSAIGTEGVIVAIDIFHMYLFGKKKDSDLAPELLALGRELLLSSNIYQSNPRSNIDCLSSIAKRCLTGAGNEQATRQVCERLLETHGSHIYKLDRFMRTLADLHPKAILEICLASDLTARHAGDYIFGRTNDEPSNKSSSSLNENVPVLITWVNEQPSERAIRLARYVSYFNEDDQGSYVWSPIAEDLIELPEVGINVLNIFYSRFDLGCGSGPWSNRLVRRRPLLTTLTSHPDESIRSQATANLKSLDAKIAELVESERVRDERFE